jgi:hypothetical protein
MTRGIKTFFILLALALMPVVAAFCQTATEPTWPQQFQVFQGESASFGFGVTQPGQITISVAAQGVPVTVALSGPLAQPLQRSGTGSLLISYSATSADVQKSALWVVRIVSANAIPAPISGLPGMVASGTVAVQHPPANLQIVQAEFQRRAAAMKSAPAPAKLASASLPTTLKTNYAAQVSSQQAAQLQRLQAKLGLVQQTPAQTQQPVTGTAAGVRPATATNVPSSTAPSSQSAPSPSISKLDVFHGQPGDPVEIDGVGFGPTPAEVHFIVSPTMDKVGTILYWSDTQILTSIPSDISGVSAYAARAYVKTSAGQSSALAKFDFNPTMDIVQLTPGPTDPDSQINQTDLDLQGSWGHYGEGLIWHNGGDDLFGHRGDDLFYKTKALINGWLVDSVVVQICSDCVFHNANAYVAESHVGTPTPYVKVHWWMDAASGVEYKLIITIKGPKGMPY